MRIASCCENPRVQQESNGRIELYRRVGTRGLRSKWPSAVNWNGSSGASAISFAHHNGAKTIVLYGFDMRRVGGEKNFHRDHHEDSARLHPFARHLRAFPHIARDAKSMGITVLNATPNSAIPHFPFIDPVEAADVY